MKLQSVVIIINSYIGVCNCFILYGYISSYGNEPVDSAFGVVTKNTAPQEFESSFGGDGFLDSSGYPYYPSNKTPLKQAAVQRVPETPALARTSLATPQTEDCRLNFSCELNPGYCASLILMAAVYSNSVNTRKK